MKFGICAPVKEVATLKSIPFDYLEENVRRFLIPEKPQEEFEEQLRAARQLPVALEAANSFIPPDLPLVATPTRPVDTVRIERFVKTALERAEQAGIKVIVFGSGDARACPEGYDKSDAVHQIGDYLATWSEWAQPHGVEIVLEPLRYQETNTLNTVAESGELVEQKVSSGARLLADTYHMANNQEDPATIVPYAPLLAHVHVAELEGRAAPGYGFDFRPYFSALKRGGYDRRISIECNWKNMPAEVDTAIATLKEQWASATA
jgi:sugar phosphate isomerase/epimerase